MLARHLKHEPGDGGITRLTKALDVNGTPEAGSIRAILAKLKAAERALTKSDAAILRAEFLAYFED